MTAGVAPADRASDTERASLEPLITESDTAERSRRANLPASLRDRYGSDLVVPLQTGRPTVIANFVSTLDGVVSYDTPEAHGGGEISGFFEPDRLVMGLLRSVADVVLIGAGTLRAGHREKWTPDYVHKPSAAAFAQIREGVGLSLQPTTAVVTASGDIDLTHEGLADTSVPVLILTTDGGAERLGRHDVAEHVDIVSLGADSVTPGAVLDALSARGGDLVLCEGGPHLIADFIGAKLVDELFLTIAPQIAGRSRDEPRLALVEGTSFTVAGAPWPRLVDLRRSGSHLFTRYRFEGDHLGRN
jgi:riboflavin biosynthesis pyrimidine reductase